MTQAENTLSGDRRRLTHPLSALKAVPLDTNSIPQRLLNIEDKVRSNLFPWEGQFTPQLVSTLLETYSGSSDFVVDPFMGSGTVLVEAAAKGLRAFGADINPAPFKMGSVYRLINVGKERRKEILESVDAQLDSHIPSSFMSPSRNGCLAEEELKTTLVNLAEGDD